MNLNILSCFKFCIFIFIFHINASTSFTQLKNKPDSAFYNYSEPSFILQLNLNYNQSIPDLSVPDEQHGRSEQIYNGKTFGSDKGFGAVITSKISIGKSGNFFFTQSLAFNRILSFNFRSNLGIPDNGYGKYNAYVLGAGLEYYYVINHRFRATAGIQLNTSMINGSAGVWLQRIGHPAGDTNLAFSISNSFRMGYGLNAGIEYLVERNIGLNIGFRLLNLNAFFKDARGNNQDLEFPLRDANNSGLIFAGRKDFLFYSILAGINLYLGRVNRKKT